jgi:hypothetical protein
MEPSDLTSMSDPMRSLFTSVSLAVLLAATAAYAEKRVFIIANNAAGYGIDRCLASGGKCGSAAAMSYCKSREFAQAVSFHKIDKDEITGTIPANSACPGGNCDQFVAIECAR